MGREVEALAAANGLTVVAKFDIDQNRDGAGLTPQSLKNVDVCIDFSVPTEVLTNLRRAAACGKNLVIGTTGWYERLDEAKKIVEEKGIGVVYAPNFSVGMNLFFRLIEEAGKKFGRFQDYDVSVHEVHHKEKLDSPSGTALEIGRILLQAVPGKKELLSSNPAGKIKPEQLQITSTRAGSFPGIHTVTFDSPADTIELRHTAKGRTGFALGALMAAKWINGKHGFYSFEEVLKEILT
jgi:4-hydroxy-tetrahydrodipicolinate reductase